MPNALLTQQNFNGGEISPRMYGRGDDAKFKSGLAQCVNFLCTPQGSCENRAGFKFVSEVKDSSKAVRLIPFIFSDSQTMVLEFGEEYVRFHTQGKTLVDGNGDIYEVATPYAEEDLFDLHFTQNADILTIVNVNYPPKELRRYSLLDWRLVTADFSPPCNPPTGLSGTYTCGDINATDEQKEAYDIKYVVTALVEDDTGTRRESAASTAATVTGNIYLDSSKVALTWTAVSGAVAYRVYKTYSGVFGYIGEVETTSFTDTNIQGDEGITPPRYDSSFSSVNGISAVTVTTQGSGYDSEFGGIKVIKNALTVHKNYRWRCDPSYIFGTCRQGDFALGRAEAITARIVDKKGKGSGCVLSVTTKYDSDKGTTVVTKVTIVSPGKDYVQPKLLFGSTDWLATFPEAGTSEAVTSAYNGTGDGYRIATDYKGSIRTITDDEISASVVDTTGYGAEIVPVVTNGKITAIRVKSGGTNYSSSAQVQINSAYGRGATFAITRSTVGDYPGAVTYCEQRRVFAGSKLKPQFVWMTRPGTESDMSYTLPVQSDNRIKFRIASQEVSRIRHVVAGTSLMYLTPTTEYRSTTSNDDAITPSSVGARAQSYVGASMVQPVIVNNNILYEAARGGHIRELTYHYQSGGYVTGDVSIRSEHLFDRETIRDMTFAKSPYPVVYCTSSSGKILALTYVPEQQIGAWSQFVTDGEFESVCCVNEDGYDALYVVVKRNIAGVEKRFVERMENRLFDAQENAFFVDSGLTYSGAPVTSVSGLTHLEGKTVSILADGSTVPQQIVENGTVTLPAEASVITVGLPIDAHVQTLPIPARLQTQHYGMKFHINRVWLRVVESKGFWIGPEEDHLVEIKQRKTEAAGTAVNLASDRLDITPYGAWTSNGQLFISQTDPLPLTISALEAEVSLS